MNKKDIINAVAQDAGITKVLAQQAVDTVLEKIEEALIHKERIILRGFGSFHTKERNARTGRHPQTGETFKVPAKVIPWFSASEDLKESVRTRKKKSA